LLTSLIYANGDRYDFQYNNYEELTKVIYPTGGYTRYDYSDFYSIDTPGEIREAVGKHVCRDEKILYDERPVFVSDEATIFDVSTSPIEELSERCAKHYGRVLSPESLKQPLWKLLRQLNQDRTG